MRLITLTSILSLTLLGSTAVAVSAPIFNQDGWSGFKRKDDVYHGCIMGRHVANDIYFLVYANASKAFSIGVSASSIDKETDEEITGTVTFDSMEPVSLTGRIIESEMALFYEAIKEDGFEPLLRKSRQIRLTYEHGKFGLPLKGSNDAVELLWDCAEKSSQEAKERFLQENKNLVQTVITGTIGVGTLDSAINGPEGSFGFLTRSPDGDKIFEICKMDDKCKITALVDPGQKDQFIGSVISVEKVNTISPAPVNKPAPSQTPKQTSQPQEVPFFSRGNWGVSILNPGTGIPHCVAWNYSSARYIQNMPQVQDEMKKAIDNCTKHITDNPNMFK